MSLYFYFEDGQKLLRKKITGNRMIKGRHSHMGLRQVWRGCRFFSQQNNSLFTIAFVQLFYSLVNIVYTTQRETKQIRYT